MEATSTRAGTPEPWTGSSPLRGPLLGLLAHQEQPITAYKLATILRQRLPAWQITPSVVSNLLKRLVDEGLVSRATPTGTTYSATERARLAVEEWMEQPLHDQAVREELLARIVSSSPRHAPTLLKVLDEFARESFEAVTDTEDPEPAPGSWTSLTINIVRRADDERLRARIAWSETARRLIEEWMSSEHASRAHAS